MGSKKREKYASLARACPSTSPFVKGKTEEKKPSPYVDGTSVNSLTVPPSIV